MLEEGVELLARGFPLSPVSRGLESVLDAAAKRSKRIADWIDVDHEGQGVARIMFDLASVLAFAGATAAGIEYAHARELKPWVDYAILAGGVYSMVTGGAHLLHRARAFGSTASLQEELAGLGVAGMLTYLASEVYHRVGQALHTYFTKG